MRTLIDNIGSAVLALVLSVMVWIVAITQGNPLREGPYPVGGLPIEIVGLPNGLVLFDNVTDRVSVNLRAPQNIWDGLTSSNFRVFVDLTNLTPGIHVVPVQVRCPDCDQRRVNMLGPVPDKITVRLDQFEEKSTAVRIDVLDNAALGYNYSVPVVTPPQVTISGPRGQVEQVTRVVGRLFLQEAKTDVERQVSLFPRDSQNQPVDRVEVQPATVSVRVPIVERQGYKEMSIKVITLGNPAPGYYVSNITVTPSTVTVFGTPGVLDKVPGVLETEPVNVDQAKETIEQRVAVKVPQGVAILGEDQTVLVHLEISALQSAQTLDLHPEPRGLGAGLTASLSPKDIQVILFGPVPDLEKLKPGDLLAVVDLAGLGPGTYKLSPQIVKPETFQVRSIVPEQLEVVIAEAPTPEPTATARK